MEIIKNQMTDYYLTLMKDEPVLFSERYKGKEMDLFPQLKEITCGLLIDGCNVSERLGPHTSNCILMNPDKSTDGIQRWQELENYRDCAAYALVRDTQSQTWQLGILIPEDLKKGMQEVFVEIGKIDGEIRKLKNKHFYSDPNEKRKIEVEIREKEYADKAKRFALSALRQKTN